MLDFDEEEFLNELKQLPDFECFPIPSHWFAKYNLAPRSVINPKEYLESNYAMKMAFAPKDLPPIIINEPQQGGKLVAVQPPENIKVEVVSRPFVLKEGEMFPAILPSLMDETSVLQALQCPKASMPEPTV